MKKTFLLPALILVLLGSCKQNSSENKNISETKYDTLIIGSKVYRYTELNHTDYNIEEDEYYKNENEALAACPDASRKGDTLLFKCENGKLTYLVNTNGEEDDFTKFDLIGWNQTINHFVVHVSLYEGQAYMLVNKANGSMLEAVGLPAVSPNRKYIVCGNSDLVAGFDFNGFQIFEKTETEYRPSGSRELINWGPVALKWKNDTTLMVKCEKLKNDGVSSDTFLTQWIVK
jgi:hypothetical protein